MKRGMSYDPARAILHKNKLLELLRTEAIDGRGAVALTDAGPLIKIAVKVEFMRKAHQMLPFEIDGLRVEVCDSL